MSILSKGLGLGVFIAVLLSSCSNPSALAPIRQSQTFVQGVNPSYLDILWVLNDQSPMSRIESQLTSQMTEFFTRFDALVSVNYQMGLTNAYDGTLRPLNEPTLVTPGVGTLSERVSLFANQISLVINMNTGAIDQGFFSAWSAIESGAFPLRQGVPLVLVFISDADDHSPLPSGTTESAVTYYANQFIGFKQGNASLVHVYSVNYEPLSAGGTRCATVYNADIDKPGFQNRYFDLAQTLNGTTADLCGNFGSQIDLSNLVSTSLPKEFVLDGTPENPASIQVSLSLNGNTLPTPPWTYNAMSHAIYFTSPPPNGSVITVSF